MLSPAESERLASWQLEIVEALCGGRVLWSIDGDEHKARGKGLGGLSVNVRSAVWFCHSKGRGGGPIELIRFLKGCNRTDALQWGEAWLRSHAGVGRAGEASERCPEIDSAKIARELIEALVEPTGTPAEAYLRSRGITIALPPCVKFLPNARTGEGALVGVLTSHGRIVGLQVGYLDAIGRKSVVPPQRRRFNLESAPDAIFELRAGGGPITVGAEGLEDGLSTLQATSNPSTRVLAVPGVGGFQHLSVKTDDNFVIVPDGDAAGSPAAAALRDGVDHLLLAEAKVWIANMPAGKDANDVLRENGLDALHALIVDAAPAKLSVVGEIKKTVRQTQIDYALNRKETAKRLGIRVSDLDAERERLRRHKPEGQVDDPDAIELLDEPVDLAETLDGIEREMRRYIVASKHHFATVPLWIVHTHLVHHERVRLHRTPRLAIQGKTPGSGKTTVLELVGALVPKPRPQSSLTASTLLRTVDALRPTVLIDEADHVLRDPKSDLLAILNCGDRRRSAFVERSVPTPDGRGWVVQRFNVFGPVAFSGIGELPPTQQDRSLVVQMVRATWDELPEHLRDGISAELILLCRKLATWANDLQESDIDLDPAMPEVLRKQAGRTGDNWRILLAIANAASPQWKERAEAAALAAVSAERRPSRTERLLISIRKVFDTEQIIVDPRDPKSTPVRAKPEKLVTKDLVDFLTGDEDEEWSTLRRGKPITPYWLRDNLQHLLDPPGAQDWWDPPIGEEPRKHRSGYLRNQFEKAWARYTPNVSYTYPPPPLASGASGVSGKPPGNSQTIGCRNAPDENDRVHNLAGNAHSAPDENDQVQNVTRSNPAKSRTSPDEPDAPDGLDGEGVCSHDYGPDNNRSGNGQNPAEVEKSAPAARPKRTRTTKPKQKSIRQTTPPAAADAGYGAEPPPVPSTNQTPTPAPPESPTAPESASAVPDENGQDRLRSWQDADLIADVRSCAAEHPEWPLAKIAAEFGQTMASIRYLLPGRQ
jgi:putative DNA primase/helicase